MIIDDIFFRRLCNWRRWARSNPRYVVKCESLESQYRNRSKQWEWMYPPQDLALRIDLNDAVELEEGCRRLNPTNQILLRYGWIRGENPKATCRRAKIAWSDYDWSFELAIQNLCRILDNY